MNQHDAEPIAPAAAPLRRFDPALPPPRDLWPQIAARLPPRRREERRYTLLRFAIAAVLVAAIALPLLRREPPPSAAPSAPIGTAAMALDAAPGSRALVKANLQLVRDSARQIRRALLQEPDSVALLRLLRTTETQHENLRRLLARST